jgi:hypothetical protein
MVKPVYPLYSPPRLALYWLIDSPLFASSDSYTWDVLFALYGLCRNQPLGSWLLGGNLSWDAFNRRLKVLVIL